MRTLVLLWAACAVAGAADSGLKPLASASEYPSQGATADFDLGAAALAPDLVRTTLVSDLNRGWVVVEVAVYPKAGKAVDLAARDFVLRVTGNSKVFVRAARPATIAGSLQKTAPTDREITVVPTAGVGYESGSVYDPVTGRRRQGGWTTSSGAGVGVGGSRPASTGRDRDTMQAELEDHALPEGRITQAVAGYLYFPLPDRKRTSAFDLEYDGASGKAEIPLAARRK